MKRTSLLDKSFETINVLRWSHLAGHIPVDDDLYDDFGAIDWVIKADEPSALNDLAVLLSILKSLEEQKHDQFCQLILVTKPVLLILVL